MLPLQRLTGSFCGAAPVRYKVHADRVGFGIGPPRETNALAVPVTSAAQHEQLEQRERDIEHSEHADTIKYGRIAAGGVYEISRPRLDPKSKTKFNEANPMLHKRNSNHTVEDLWKRVSVLVASLGEQPVDPALKKDRYHLGDELARLRVADRVRRETAAQALADQRDTRAARRLEEERRAEQETEVQPARQQQQPQQQLDIHHPIFTA